jgi:hypothetical protein
MTALAQSTKLLPNILPKVARPANHLLRAICLHQLPSASTPHEHPLERTLSKETIRDLACELLSPTQISLMSSLRKTALGSLYELTHISPKNLAGLYLATCDP